MNIRRLRCERVLVNAGNAQMMLRGAGWGGCACCAWLEQVAGCASDDPKGGGCVQAIRSQQLGQRRWHRVWEG